MMHKIIGRFNFSLPSNILILFFRRWMMLLPSFLFFFLLPSSAAALDDVRHCSSADLLFQYTPCDQNNQRWLFAIPRSHTFLCSPESIPPPKHGLNCSFTCPAGHFLEMHSQQCKICEPGSFSLGDRVRYDQFESNKLPEGFSIENSPDESFGGGGGNGGQQHCWGGGGWALEEGELRYRWTHCVSTLSISLHLTRPGFAEFQYQMSKDSRGLIQMLQVRNAQCQSYGNTRNSLLSRQWAANNRRQQQPQHGGGGKKQKAGNANGGEDAEGGQGGGGGGPDIRVQKLALKQGQNLITWTVAINPVLSSRMEMIRLIRLDISGLAFSPECTACPGGTFSPLPGAQQCQPCGPNEFAPKGASLCEKCPTTMWAEPRSELCLHRPACSSIDFFPVRPSSCLPSVGQKIYPRKIVPPICWDDAAVPFMPETRSEECPVCGPGMHRNPEGKCQKCPDGEVSPNGKECSPCPANSIPEHGLFITCWDSLPSDLEMKMECEFLSAEDAPGECHIEPAWISHSDRLESVQTRMRGIALELTIPISHGFYSPLHSGKPSSENPIGQIALDVQLECRDSCQFYVVQEFDAPTELAISLSDGQAENVPRQLQMLALLNGTHARRLLSFPIVDARPRHLMIAFTRSGALVGRDEIGDRAIIYSLNVTNTGREDSQSPSGLARRCLECPRMEKGKCRPCPPGEYFAQSSCHSCPPGTVLNQTALSTLDDANSSASSSSTSAFCSPCPPHFVRSSDGFSCEFSGNFDLMEEEEEEGSDEGGGGGEKKKNNGKTIHFDLSPLKEAQMSARGIRVFAHDGQSYLHVFNISIFPQRPIQCHDTVPGRNSPQQMEDVAEDGGALFCRFAAIPLANSLDQQNGEGTQNNNNNNGNGSINEMSVSSTIISQKLALVTRERQFGNRFYLSDDQLEYESSTAGGSAASKSNQPMDLHFFFEPLPSLQQNGIANCPNGTLAAVTVRCEPTAIAKPLARLSRHCPDGTCDGCLYHVIVESAHGCPVCTANDYQEIRGECVNDRQRVHSIPAKHCVLSGAKSQEREQPCQSILTPNVRLLLALAISMIILLLLLISVIYRRNRTLEYRYSRLVEGREMDSGVRSCALGGSDDDDQDEDENGDAQSEEEEEGKGKKQHKKQQIIDSSRTRVFFNNRKANPPPSSTGAGGGGGGGGGGGNAKYGQKKYGGRAEERREFIAELEEESD